MTLGHMLSICYRNYLRVIYVIQDFSKILKKKVHTYFLLTDISLPLMKGLLLQFQECFQGFHMQAKMASRKELLHNHLQEFPKEILYTSRQLHALIHQYVDQ